MQKKAVSNYRFFSDGGNFLYVSECGHKVMHNRGIGGFATEDFFENIGVQSLAYIGFAYHNSFINKTQATPEDYVLGSV